MKRVYFRDELPFCFCKFHFSDDVKWMLFSIPSSSFSIYKEPVNIFQVYSFLFFSSLISFQLLLNLRNFFFFLLVWTKGYFCVDFSFCFVNEFIVWETLWGCE